MCIAGAAALAVVAYARLRSHSPEAEPPVLVPFRELAAVVHVKAVEGVADVSAQQRVRAPAASSWGYRDDELDEDER